METSTSILGQDLELASWQMETYTLEDGSSINTKATEFYTRMVKNRLVSGSKEKKIKKVDEMD